MKRVFVALTVILLSVVRISADFATPFAEGTKVGDVRTERAWVITESPQGLSDDFIVLVTSDTEQWVPLFAKAKKGVVRSELLGRPVMVTARVTAKFKDNYDTTLEILRVESVKK